MKTTVYILVAIASMGVAFLRSKNKEKEKATKKRMQEKLDQEKDIEALQASAYKNHKIAELIIELKRDTDKYKEIGNKLTDQEILQIEKEMNVDLPESFKIFLKYFGDGVWIHGQSIDSVKRLSWLKKYRENLRNTISFNNGEIVNTDSLLCLMTEDSNGGAWCWLTSEKTENGEFPLAYYNMIDNKLHFKLNNFTEWLQLLVSAKTEVIFTLDRDSKLGLG